MCQLSERECTGMLCIGVSTLRGFVMPSAHLDVIGE